MLVETVERDGKTMEVREGSAGNGDRVFVVQAVVNGVCKAQTTFKTKDAAMNWAEWA